MKVYVFTSSHDVTNSDVSTLMQQAGMRGLAPEQIDTDTQAGSDMAARYDITARPALLVASEDGSAIQLWQGELPSMSDLEYVVHG